jgi:hypothetical protein
MTASLQVEGLNGARYYGAEEEKGTGVTVAGATRPPIAYKPAEWLWTPKVAQGGIGGRSKTHWFDNHPGLQEARESDSLRKAQAESSVALPP